MSISELLRRRSRGRALKEAIRRYTGDNALKLALDPSTPEREEKEIICVATKVRDFESIFGRMTMQTVGLMMNRYYALIAETMMHSEGDISEFCGPTIIAHFGLHRQVEDETQMITAVSKEFGAAAASLETQFGVHIGMGMCRGTVIYRNFGSLNRIAYTAFGPPILCAERLATRNNGLSVCELFAKSISLAGVLADLGMSVDRHWEPQEST